MTTEKIPTDRKSIFKELEHEIQYYSESTKSQYRAHVDDYFTWLKGKNWQERDVLYTYLDYLKKNRDQTYVNYIIRGPIGCLFRMYGLRVPVKLPKVNRQMIDLASRFSYSAEEIRALILTAKKSSNPQWLNTIALSTTYGLRVGELFGVRSEDIHPYKKTIIIHTEKGGMLREHDVPEQIAPFVFKYTYPPVGYNRRFSIFHEIANVAGVKFVPKKCYHGVRHGLATVLDELRGADGKRILDQTRVYQFLRWAGGGMMNIYTTPRMPEVDAEIFKYHPFLKDWE